MATTIAEQTDTSNIMSYYMASSMSGQDEPNSVL